MGGLTTIVVAASLVGAIFGAGHTHPHPVRVLNLGHNRVVLPMKSATEHSKDLAAIKRLALIPTGGGQVESVRPSVWVGKPVWMCTIDQGHSVWHVMISQTTLQPISKMMVPRR